MTTSNSNTSSQSTTTPGAEAQPIVHGITDTLTPLIANSGITPTQQTAIGQLTANGVAGDQFAPAEATNANTLLAGGGATDQNPTLQSNLDTLKSTVAPYTDPNYSTVNSQPVQAAIQAANTNVTNQVNGEFAGAGREGSGENQEALAEGESLADAPLILNQANTDTATRLGAANALYGAGNTTSGAITGNTQTSLGNEAAGVGAGTSAIAAQNEGPTAAIEAQELGQQIPAQNLGLLANIGIPLAGLNTTTNGNSNTQTTPSTLQDLTSLGGLFATPGSAAGGGASAIAGLGNAASSLGSGALAALAAL